MKRLAAIALVGLGLAGLAGCGGSDNSASTVTSTVTVTSGSSPSGTRTYTGTTDQDLPITLTATQDAVLSLTFGWRAPCDDGKERSNSIRIGGAPIRDGSFSFDSVLETGGVAQVEGKIEGDSASGTLSRSKGTAFGINCEVTGVAWQADAG